MSYLLQSIILGILVTLSLQDVFLPHTLHDFSCPAGFKAAIEQIHSCLQHVPDLVSQALEPIWLGKVVECPFLIMGQPKVNGSWQSHITGNMKVFWASWFDRQRAHLDYPC